MVRIFFIAVIILGVVSGVVSFRTRGTLADLRTQVQNLTQESARHAQNAKEANEKASALENELTKTKAARDEAAAAAAKAQGEADRLAQQLKDVQNAISEKEAEIARLKEEAAKAQASATTPAVDPELEAKLKDLEVKLAEQTQVAQALEAKKKEAESRLAEMEQREQLRQKALNRPGIEGKVLVVNPAWNFVILNLGDRQGVALNSTLLVMRGSERIARLKVTSIDPNRSIADIVPGSVARGTTVLPGDKVIFASGS